MFTRFKAVSGITIRRIRMTNIDFVVLYVAITINLSEREVDLNGADLAFMCLNLDVNQNES